MTIRARGVNTPLAIAARNGQRSMMTSVSPRAPSANKKPATASDGAQDGSAKGGARKLPEGLTDERLVTAYENMQLSRRLDDKMLVLLKQGKSFFHIGAMGHEAVQTAAAFALTPKR